MLFDDLKRSLRIVRSQSRTFTPSVRWLVLRSIALFLITFSLAGFASAATFTVTKTADTNDGACNADCSLREALVAANAAPNADVIEFEATVFSTPQTIVLNGTNLTIAELTSLTINGPGSSLLTISANGLSRVFIAEAGTTTTIRNLTIANGRATTNGGGAGVYQAGGALAIENVVFSNNTSVGEGGAIYAVSGSMTVTGSTFANNRSDLEGGAIAGNTFSGDPPPITISNSTFTGNSSIGRAGGAISGILTLIVSDSTFTNNSAPSGGAASSGSFTNVTFNNNTATSFAGGARTPVEPAGSGSGT